MSASTVVVRFIGEDSSLRRSLTGLAALSGKAATGLGKVAKPLAMLGAAGNAVKLLGGTAAALQQLAPAALLLPGALLAGAAAMATFKIGMMGVGDAIKSGDMSKLAPQAREFATAVRSMAPEFQNLQRSVQGALFAELGQRVKELGKDYFPILQKQLPLIASGFNDMAHGMIDALKAPSTRNDVNEILESTSDLLGEMPNALGNVTKGFIGLGAVGARYLKPLGGWIESATEKFKKWVDQGVESGRINELIDGAIAGFKDLSHIVGNVGSILGSIWSGLSGGSGATSPLAALRATTDALAAFFKTAEAQGPLKALGETMAVVGEQLNRVLIAALKAVGPIVEALAPIVQSLAVTLGDVLTSAFEQLGPPIARFITKVAPIAEHVFPAIGAVLKDVVIPALAGFINWLSDHIDEIQSFAEQSVILFLEMTQAALGFASGVLGAMSNVFAVLGLMPGKFGESMRAAAVSTNTAKEGVDAFRGTVDLMHDKAVEIHQNGAEAATSQVKWLWSAVDSLHDKTIYVDQITRYGSIGGPSLVAAAHGRAVGGRVNKGQTYMVGERGPELLTMDGGGFVTPNHRLRQGGSGGGGSAQVTFAGNTSDALATVIMQMIRSGKIQIKAA